MSHWYPPSRPRAVENGIKAKTTRGAIGETWWSRRFVDILESFALGTRLTRGRNYARRGQVTSLAVARGQVSADVQGSRARPYRVRIGLAPYPETTWQRLEAELVKQARYSAMLLAGEMPPDLENVFAAAGVSLFPASRRDLTMHCSCPDDAVPCKHLAATLYLLAEAFDADPFQILQWRGRPREDLLNRLRALRNAPTGPSGPDTAGSGAPGATGQPGPADQVIGAAVALAGVTSAPLADCVDRFWVPSQPLPPQPAALAAERDLLLRQLPPLPERSGGSELLERLRVAHYHSG